jgi:hypothetical protein
VAVVDVVEGAVAVAVAVAVWIELKQSKKLRTPIWVADSRIRRSIGCVGMMRIKLSAAAIHVVA